MMPYDFTRLNLFIFPTLLAIVINLVLFVLVIIKNHRSQLNRSFAWWCVIVSFHAFGVFTMYLSNNVIVADISQKLFNIFLILMPPVFLGFIFTFVNNNKWKRMLPIFYLFSYILIYSLFYTPWFVSRTYFSGWPFFYKIKGEILYLVFILYFIYAAVLGVYLLIKKLDGASRHYYNQVVYLSLAIVTGGILCTINMIMVYFGREFDTPSYTGVSLYGLLVTYSILKYRLMDITVIIRKGLVYTILVGFFTGLYLAGIFLLGQLLQGMTGGSYLVLTALTIILMALGFQPIKSRVQEYIDNAFFKGKYDYSKALKQISKNISEAMSIEEINQKLAEGLKEYMDVGRAEVRVITGIR